MAEFQINCSLVKSLKTHQLPCFFSFQIYENISDCFLSSPVFLHQVRTFRHAVYFFNKITVVSSAWFPFLVMVVTVHSAVPKACGGHCPDQQICCQRKAKHHKSLPIESTGSVGRRPVVPLHL